MAPLPSPYRNPYYMDSLRGGGMGQVMPTNIPYRDPGYGSPMRTQNLIQSLRGPQYSFRDPNRKYNTMRMLENFRGGNMGPILSPYPMPSPYEPYGGGFGGKGGRMPMPGMPGMPGKGGRMPGMPGKGGQMPPDQGMPNPDIGVDPIKDLPSDTGTPPAGGSPIEDVDLSDVISGDMPGGGTPPADTTPANNLTDAQRNILAEQGFTEQEATDAFNAIIQDQAGTLDPRFADLIGTGYYPQHNQALWHGFFQVVSFGTNTGFTSTSQYTQKFSKTIYVDSTKGWPSKYGCLLYTSPSPRDRQKSRMPSSA